MMLKRINDYLSTRALYIKALLGDEHNKDDINNDIETYERYFKTHLTNELFEEIRTAGNNRAQYINMCYRDEPTRDDFYNTMIQDEQQLEEKFSQLQVFTPESVHPNELIGIPERQIVKTTLQYVNGHRQEVETPEYQIYKRLVMIMMKEPELRYTTVATLSKELTFLISDAKLDQFCIDLFYTMLPGELNASQYPADIFNTIMKDIKTLVIE